MSTVGIDYEEDRTGEDDAFSFSQTSGSSGLASSTRERMEKEMQSSIAKKEERIVFFVRVLILVAIVCSAMTVTIAVYFFASAADTASFEAEYFEFARDVETLVVWEVKYNMALVQQLGGTTTSTALMTNQTFPFVTQPHFEITGGFVDGMGGIMMALSAPLIAASERETWEEYSVANQDWIQESARLKVVYEKHRDPLHGTIQDHEHDRLLQSSISDKIPDMIWEWKGDEKVVANATSQDQLFAPLWQSSPAEHSTVNVDLLSDGNISQLFTAMMHAKETVMSPGLEIGNLFDWMFDPVEKFRKAEPHAYIMEPMYSNYTEQEEPVGFLLALTSYRNLFTRLLPDGVNGMYCVITDTCGNAMTFVLNGADAVFLGYDDVHEGYEEYEIAFPLELYEHEDVEGLCAHEIHIYPSFTMVTAYKTNNPAIYTSIVALAFGLTSLLLVIYDRLVTRRQERTKNAALRVVSSLFPSNVQDKVLKGAIDGPSEASNVIASFFPATTVMFADISGFTAWASTREPAQVFQLLETIYGAFDEIARRKQIFKVETVGDCYVAVAGLPDPRPDHAVAMVRFARDCQAKMAALSHQLEISLGPDTADLAFRIGLHSGAVTGGVLRGQNSRFQLFGDTMNMAARMETTGARNRIHISGDTAELLKAAGKDSWIEKRKEQIDVKGKGLQHTYWVKMGTDSTGSACSGSVHDGSEALPALALPNSNDKVNQQKTKSTVNQNNTLANDTKTMRLVEWNVAVLTQRLQAIKLERDGNDKIDSKVVEQLKQHVHGIASMYRKNPFHNFEHASHVTMSCMKMLSRVNHGPSSPPQKITVSEETERTNSEIGDFGDFKEYTNDITACPLTQFAVVYAALIHDVDHAGVSNDQLIKEGARIAAIYNNKSVAENHSFHLAWGYLMQPEFQDLMNCICGSNNQTEQERFSGILQNAVLATDVFDKQLKADRDARWAHVFGDSPTHEDRAVLNSLKAQIVLEHLIQTSDIIHTMQHWHIYRKWNERLFNEMYEAFKAGRMGKNPAEFWYKGEIGFFQFYVIPLARKIGECGVFGVSSDEFLKYAQANLKEWELKGEEIVEELVQKYCIEGDSDENAAMKIVPVMVKDEV
mmetsp:Transcript_20032/g.35262  ORF Transcript_20032/g.35262 Transcript_20032/m.35262 type:complete len:1107 (-) Transcript_20032:235-3555(-)